MHRAMDHRRSHPDRDGKATRKHKQEQHHLSHELSLALHRSVFAQLTRLVPDPDQPGRNITTGELELRMRGRIYRQAASGCAQGPQAE